MGEPSSNSEQCIGGDLPPVRLTFLIRSLEIGGAERQLVELARGLHAKGAHVTVLTFYSGGALRPDLECAGVTVRDLAKRGRWDVLPFLWRLVRALRRVQPQVLYTFLPMANVLGVLVRPALREPVRLVWGVRASNVDLDRYDGMARFTAWLERRLAARADLTIANSRAGRDHHVALGFPADRCVVIPNGIDVTRYRYDPEGRRRVRAEWGVSDRQVLIGIAARLDPMKGYETFIDAAARTIKSHPQVRFACVGSGPPQYRERLARHAEALGLRGRLIWAGAREDMPAVYSAFDIATSCSSYGEGFSNAIAEAMACERPLVVTNVGDSAALVGEAGCIVPPRSAEDLCRAWEVLIGLPAASVRSMGEIARRRIADAFSVETLVDRTIDCLLGRCKGSQP